jgi:hypothetical protein
MLIASRLSSLANRLLSLLLRPKLMSCCHSHYFLPMQRKMMTKYDELIKQNPGGLWKK